MNRKAPKRKRMSATGHAPKKGTAKDKTPSSVISGDI